MSVETVQPFLAVQAVHRQHDASGNPGRDPRRYAKPGQAEKKPQDQPDIFLNELGQLTGKTINITA